MNTETLLKYLESSKNASSKLIRGFHQPTKKLQDVIKNGFIPPSNYLNYDMQTGLLCVRDTGDTKFCAVVKHLNERFTNMNEYIKSTSDKLLELCEEHVKGKDVKSKIDAIVHEVQNETFMDLLLLTYIITYY
jgi:hypothetical protein